MRLIGAPTDWVNLIDSLVPDILALVISTWEEMPAPAGDALEDPISTALCLRLRAGRNRCDLPFDIWTQLVELEPAAGEDQGRMDIVFKPMVPREYIYFCLECKRLNVRTAAGVRPYTSEYVRFGMLRFVKGQYASIVRHGGMLAYVLDADVSSAIAGVQVNIQTQLAELGMDAPGTLLESSILPSDARVRETRHRREASPNDPFVIQHLFMAGDPNAPLLPVAPAPPTAGKKPKRTAGRRKLRQ